MKMGFIPVSYRILFVKGDSLKILNNLRIILEYKVKQAIEYTRCLAKCAYLMS